MNAEHRKRLNELTELQDADLSLFDLVELCRLRSERIDELETLISDWGRSGHDMPFEPRICKCPECVAMEDEATAIHMRQCEEKTSAEQLQSHSERLAEAGRREASLRNRLLTQTRQTQITVDAISNAVNEKLAWHNVVPGGLTLKEHPCEQNVGTCVARLLNTIADLREETTLLKLVTRERDELQAVVREIDEGDNPGLWGSLVAQRDKLQVKVERLQREKAARVYYQDIVYATCNALDKMSPNEGHIVCGTLEMPTTGVQDALQRLQRQMTACKGATWSCPYCGEATRDRSSAMLHPAMCEKWPYRLEVERLKAVLVDRGADLAIKLWRIARDGVESDGKIRNDIGLLLIQAVREAAIAQERSENTEGES